MVALAKRALAAVVPGTGRVIVITPPPVHEPSRILHASQNYGAPLDKPVDRSLEASGQYAAAACRAAATAGVGCVDMWTLFQAEGGDIDGGDDGASTLAHRARHHRAAGGSSVSSTPPWAALLSDGLHFSPAGDEVAFNAISAAIAAHAAHLSPEALPMDAPEWRDLGSYVGGGGGEEVEKTS
jgi:lysophospholipase L1-like esterase